MTTENDTDLEAQIAEWRTYMLRRRAIHGSDVDELEDHLRERVGDLTETGLRPDEAFLIAVKRMGRMDELSREFAREHSDRLWKQLVLTPDAPAEAERRRDLLAMVVCAALAALAVKLPTLFGLDLDQDQAFYARNAGLFALAPLTAYFAWRRRVGTGTGVVLALLFVLGAVGANAYRLDDDSQSIVLSALHLPLALWLVVGLAYAAGDWRSGSKRMDFIRFTGEWFIYFVLIALGGGVLTGVTVGTFSAIGIDAEVFISEWLLPCGAAAAVIVAAWLVEAKQGVIENMAPVLTRVFTPLFAVTLVAVLIAIAVTTNAIDVERDMLILFDLLLVVVLGLVLYSISARDPGKPAGIFDWMQLALVVSALLIDVLVLIAITGRITEWGFTPNKSAALGENLILFVNLAWTAWLYFSVIKGRKRFALLERWQTDYVPVYAAWAWTVVLVFPPLFAFA
ncbi:permease prefix domain 1-containing protein [Glycomyces sp. TRM65418]|uniref:permease prefix domain 1-containing protein n=1 Tax=Glycomyces sp. TRM65418 TaxID=2867006 RepID=UPI001CE4CC5D|nr:permease prefix domain 1-containing protein [Glycomyces sp. TRM65418]MCC3762896.1 permease prefix domain 1-containing protein [Glycomyces sp. TRM65418]QZD56921.1 permease prefix domain 1-containing protein [Glycomyces sp. TRM65418]